LAILACLMWPVLPANQGTHTDTEKIQNGTSIENSEQDRKKAFKFKHIKKHIQHCIERNTVQGMYMRLQRKTALLHFEGN
jgi:hypothetical protein